MDTNGMEGTLTASQSMDSVHMVSEDEVSHIYRKKLSYLVFVLDLSSFEHFFARVVSNDHFLFLNFFYRVKLSKSMHLYKKKKNDDLYFLLLTPKFDSDAVDHVFGWQREENFVSARFYPKASNLLGL